MGEQMPQRRAGRARPARRGRPSPPRARRGSPGRSGASSPRPSGARRRAARASRRRRPRASLRRRPSARPSRRSARSASTARDTRNVDRAPPSLRSRPTPTRSGTAAPCATGSHIYVAGTAPRAASSRSDPYEQAKRCLEIIVEALREVGAEPEHVVRTRVYIVDPARLGGDRRAHGEVFGAIRPAVGDARHRGTARSALEGRDRGGRAASR